MIYIVATEAEKDLVRELFGEVKDEDITVTGVGIINALRVLRDIPRDEIIMNVGYVGSNKLDVGKWVEVSSVQMHHPEVGYEETPIVLADAESKHIRVPCYTSSSFVLQTNVEDDAVFDMELAAIAAMGFKKVSALKKVSDNLSLHDYEKNVEGKNGIKK